MITNHEKDSIDTCFTVLTKNILDRSLYRRHNDTKQIRVAAFKSSFEYTQEKFGQLLKDLGLSFEDLLSIDDFVREMEQQ